MAEVVLQLALVLLVLCQEEFAERAQLGDSALVTALKLGGGPCEQRAVLSAALFRFHVGCASFVDTFQVVVHVVDPAFFVRALALSSAARCVYDRVVTIGRRRRSFVVARNDDRRRRLLVVTSSW